MRRIEVRLEVLEDSDTGELLILPTERDLAESEAAMAEAEQAAEGLPAARRKAQMQAVAQMRAALERARRMRAALQNVARTERYTLRCPTYGQYSEAEGEASEVTPDGEVRIDERRLLHALLPSCVEGLSRQEVLDLPPQVVLVLWKALRRAVTPDESRLPFWYQRCTTGQREG